MPVTPEFRDYVIDQLAGFADIQVRAMFGGYGLYAEGEIFSFLLDDVLYFKADDANRGRFEAEGARQFVPFSRGKPFPMPYWDVPLDVIEDSDRLCAWAAMALAAGRRGKTRKVRPDKTTTGKTTARKTKTRTAKTGAGRRQRRR